MAEGHAFDMLALKRRLQAEQRIGRVSTTVRIDEVLGIIEAVEASAHFLRLAKPVLETSEKLAQAMSRLRKEGHGQPGPNPNPVQ